MPSRRAFAAAAAVTFSAVPIIRMPARAAQFECRCASNLPVHHPISLRLTQMFAAIEKDSGGRLHTQFFPNSQLGGDAAMFSQLRLGALQFFHISPGNLSTLVPVADIAYTGFAYKDDAEGSRVADGPLGDYVRKEVGAKGLY